MSPWSRRTTWPSFKSIDGIMVNFSNTRPILGERALGRKHALEPRLRLRRMIHRTRERFESRLDNMMRVAATDEIQMQVHPDLVSHRLHEVVDQLGLKIAHPLLADLHVVAKIRTPADIDNRGANRLVQRHRRLADAPDSRAVAERLPKRAPEHDSDVFDRVMVIYMQIARGLDCEIEKSVAGETLKHMIEEWNPGSRLATPRAVKREIHGHRSLASLALDRGAAARSSSLTSVS